MRSYSTKEAGKLVGVHAVTLHRWIAEELVRPSIAIPMGPRQTLWRWTPEDVKRAKRLKGTFKSGPKPKAKKRV